MNNKKWGVILVAFIILLILYVMVWGAYKIGLDIGETRGYRDQNTQYYETHANDEIKTRCLSFEGKAVVDCVNAAIESKNEQQRAESDLVVQTEMATWARWMFVITALITAITAVGVYYVWRTLIETQKMATDTQRIGEAQVRAYLNVSKCRVCFEKQSIIWNQIEIRNTGSSPARLVEIAFTVAPPNQPNAGVFHYDCLPVDDIPANSIGGIEKITSVWRDYVLENRSDNTDQILVTFDLVVFACDVFGDEIAEYSKWFAYIRNSDVGELFVDMVRAPLNLDKDGIAQVVDRMRRLRKKVKSENK